MDNRTIGQIAPRLRMSLCLGRKPSSALRATCYVRSEEARQLIIDWGFAFEFETPMTFQAQALSSVDGWPR